MEWPLGGALGAPWGSTLASHTNQAQIMRGTLAKVLL